MCMTTPIWFKFINYAYYVFSSSLIVMPKDNSDGAKIDLDDILSDILSASSRVANSPQIWSQR